MTFHRVLAEGDLWAGELEGVLVNGVKVVLVRIDDEVHAYEDRCAHLGVELSRGRLDARVLTCFAHEWKYDVVTGRGINPRTTCLRRFPVKIEDGSIFVDVDGSERGT